VDRGFQFEILFSESDWHLGPFWSRSWTVIDDGVHRPEIIISLLLGMADPPEIGMMVPKDGKTFEFWGLELDFGLDELSGGGGKISRIGCGCWID
jgi:hypothetical protein